MIEHELRRAYGQSAAAWAAGPHRMYRRLSEATLAAGPPVAGGLLLDVGAGTGAGSQAGLAAGARVIAVDAAAGMLAYDRKNRPPSVTGDAYRLPFRAAVFDAVLAPFVLNHLDEPVVALAELTRVTRALGWLYAATFRDGWEHPAKSLVETVAAEYGWRRPTWHASLKARNAPALGTPDRFATIVRDAGWVDSAVAESTVDTGLRTSEELVAWRLGMAHLAPFVASLRAERRERLWRAAVRRIGAEPPPLCPRILVCVARRPPGVM